MKNFYNNLYKEKYIHNIDNTNFTNTCNNMPKLNEEDRKMLEKEISVEYRIYTNGFFNEFY